VLTEDEIEELRLALEECEQAHRLGLGEAGVADGEASGVPVSEPAAKNAA
jgi:hypothetical protein